MKYIVVWYVDSMPFGSKEFDDKEEAYKLAKEMREQNFWEDVTVWEVNK
jgi:hypothetical protein